jgi:hypothetical protein
VGICIELLKLHPSLDPKPGLHVLRRTREGACFGGGGGARAAAGAARARRRVDGPAPR